ncbi:hypothetical protein DCE79_03920 [Lysinibacillus sp. 2017]|uniref:DUF881 domain-containing protein n=1 Tax=unclassified Lysinibacillus TaxID=2636778 RepID=UPI000D5262E5|nr:MULTISPECIES: DUF881 domain-containing protein [unclassified Lysinibacillus]AWE06584.1 hypothetical protein DCE79_03920 [Lysinibacillus sp. 2017]TGN35379.1 DUF881 domain-containing protein [Lysinibacillus sp. S2017]
MTKKMYRNITIISFIIGFMLAVQYNTVQNPTERNTSDIWEIRQELSAEKSRHSELLSQISSISTTVDKYEDAEFDNPELLLQQTVDQLKKQAGILPISGPGVALTIEPSTELLQYGYEINPISPELLIRLINDLYRYNAEMVEIDGKRLTYNTAIRDINGKTTVNSEAIDKTDIKINVITQTMEQAEKLKNHLLASTFPDEFYIDNLLLTVEDAKQNIRINSTVTLQKSKYLEEK